MAVHTHDGIDWSHRLAAMRRADELDASGHRQVATRLSELVAPGATVADIGPGAGGMSAALAVELAARGGGELVLVDAVPEVLEAAESAVSSALEASPGKESVAVRALRVDAASDELPTALPVADLVWASRVVHHLPDQAKGIAGLVGALAPGGWLALVEGGLPIQCLPWDLGIGEPGFSDRLATGWRTWFARMRADMPGVVRLTVGWNRALVDAGLTDVSSASYLLDHPAPASESVRLSVVDWLIRVGEAAKEYLDGADRVVLERLLDPNDHAYVAARDDVFLLGASTVYLGRKPAR